MHKSEVERALDQTVINARKVVVGVKMLMGNTTLNSCNQIQGKPTNILLSLVSLK